MWGLFDAEHIRKIATVLEREFLTIYGMSTVSHREDCYNPEVYARGAVWPFMNYMVYKGLVQGGCNELAEKVMQGVVKLAE